MSVRKGSKEALPLVKSIVRCSHAGLYFVENRHSTMLSAGSPHVVKPVRIVSTKEKEELFKEEAGLEETEKDPTDGEKTWTWNFFHLK